VTALLALAAWAFQRRDTGSPLLFRRPPAAHRKGRVQRPGLRTVWSARCCAKKTGLLVWFVAVETWMGLMAWMEPSVVDVWDKFDFTGNLNGVNGVGRQ